MSVIHQLTLAVPEDLYRQFNGVTFDVGITLIKFAYRRKVTDGENNRFSNCLQLVTFRGTELDDAFEYVRQRADIRRDGDQPITLVVTGVGSATHSEEICQALGVNKLQVISEIDCNVASFVYLARHLPRSEFLEPFVTDAVAEVVAQTTAWNSSEQMMKSSGMTAGVKSEGRMFEASARRISERAKSYQTIVHDETSLIDEQSDIFPCLHVMFGSTAVFTEIATDSSLHILDMSSRSSESFVGLAKLIVDPKVVEISYRSYSDKVTSSAELMKWVKSAEDRPNISFDELIELAAKGDARKITKYTDQYAAKDKLKEDIYSQAIDRTSVPTCSFGHVAKADKGDLKREDLAIALLKYVVSDMVERAQFWCQTRALKRVFFGSSFCNNPFVRRIITAEFVYRMLYRATYVEEDFYLDFDFIRPGSYLGALGCTLKDLGNE